MGKIELILPKMGESVSEATIITWTKEVGDTVEMDETIIEVATDKVDSEVPSAHDGKLVEKLFDTDDVIEVGKPFAILEVDGEEDDVVEKQIVKELEEPISNLSTNTDVIISASLVRIFGSLYILTSGNIDTEVLLLTISKFATRDL